MNLFINHEIEPIRIEPISKKEYFRRGENLVLYQGDSTQSNLFSEEFIDLIVTSPPYNVGIDYNSNNDSISYEDYLAFTHHWMMICY